MRYSSEEMSEYLSTIDDVTALRNRLSLVRAQQTRAYTLRKMDSLARLQDHEDRIIHRIMEITE